MPVHSGHDSLGDYYQWGQHGKRYYYDTPEGKEKAYESALRQARAIYASGYRG
jgi:hypothetical protein